MGIVDIHCHILPGVDDGSYSMEESMRMAAMAVESGVSGIVATPHCNIPSEPDPIWAPDLPRKLNALREALRENDISLNIYQGMEIFGTPEVPKLLQEGMLCTLAGSRYLLIEFPFTDYGEEATRILHRILTMGYRPIVAHPERYAYVQQTPQIVNIWRDLGCLLQVNKGSVLGRFGRHAQKIAYELLERGFVTCVGSDAHRSRIRTTWMADVAQELEENFGRTAARQLLRDNPHRILADEELAWDEPEWF